MKLDENQKICILGCGGFIGSHLVERLLSETTAEVMGFDLATNKIAHLVKNPRFTFISGDMYESDALEDAIHDADILVSLTAICNPALYNTLPLDVIDANFTRPLAVAELCSEYHTRLIHFSTSEVYGKTPAGITGTPADDTPLNEESSHLILGGVSKQRWTYACAKQLMERVIFALGREEGLAYTIIRPFNFIGARMDYLPSLEGGGVPRVLACFMDALLTGTPLELVDGGKNKRVFTSIHDAIDALMAVIEHPEESKRKIFNIGNPANELSIRELAEMMFNLYETVAGEPPSPNTVMVDVSAQEFYGEGYDDSDRRIPDISAATACLGWKPRLDLQTTLQDAMSGLIREYRVRKSSRV